MKKIDLRTDKLDNNNGTFTKIATMRTLVTTNPCVDRVIDVLDLEDLYNCVTFDNCGTAHFTVYTDKHGEMVLTDCTCDTIDCIVAKSDVMSEKEYTLNCVNDQGEIIDTSRFIEWLIECVNEFDVENTFNINYYTHKHMKFAEGIMWDDNIDHDMNDWIEVEISDIAYGIKREQEYIPYNPFMEY